MGKGRVKSINKTLKFTGILCGAFTGIQALIWIALTLTGFICFFVDTGEGEAAESFHEIYMDLSNHDSPAVAVKPMGFMVLVCLYFFLSAAWLFTSLNLISVYQRWNNVSEIKKSSRYWMMITLILIIIDLIVFIVFLVDFVQIGKHAAKKTRAGDMDINIAKKFAFDFSKLMTRDYMNQSIKKIDDLYRKKYNIQGEGNQLEPPKEEPPKNDSTKNDPARRRKRTFPGFTDMLFYPIKMHYNATAYLYSWLPSMPIPGFIRNILGNPFQPLIDAYYYYLFGPIHLVTTTKAPVVIERAKKVTPKLPPAVCMTVALGGLLIWIANICLLAFMFSLLKKLRVEMNGIFGCFTDMCNQPKPKGKKRKRPAAY